MPTFKFTSPRTGATYDLDFDNDPTEADLEEARADLDMREQATGQTAFQAASGEVARGALSVPKGIIGGAGAVTSLIPGMEDNFIQRGAESFQAGYEDVIPVDPSRREDFAVKAAGAAGQGLGFLGTTYLTAGLGATPAIARGVGLGTAGLMGAEQGAKTAEQYGLTDWTDRAAMTLGGAGIEAGTEMLGGFGSKNFTEALLGRLKSAARPGSAIARFGKTAASEGGEEMLAGQAQDFLTGALVDEDPNRPGFATNGVPLPPDTFTMQNLWNRLEEGALGAVGGTVFAGAEALGSRTPIDEALAARLQARTRVEELRQKDQLTAEEQDELSQIEAEDQNVAAWLNRQGLERTRPVVESFAQNPQSLADTFASMAEDQGREKEAAVWRSERGLQQATEEISQYKGLMDALSEAEAAGNVEAANMARDAMEDHVLGTLNPLSRPSQDRSLGKTVDERIAKLKARVQAANPIERAAMAAGDAMVNEVVKDAPQTAKALQEVLKTPLPSVPQQTTQAQSGPAITPASVSAEQLEVVRKIKKGDAYKLTNDELRSVGLMRDPNGKITNAQIKQGDPEPLAKIVKGLVTISPSVDSTTTTTPPQTNASAIQSSTQMGSIPSGPEGPGESGTAGMAVLNQGQAPAGTNPQEEVNAPVPTSTQQPTLAQPAAEEDYALPPLKSQLNKGPVAREDAEFAKDSYLQANPERAPFLQNAWIGSTKELSQDKQVRDAVIAGRNMGRETPLTPAQEEQEWRMFLMRRHEGFQFGDRPYILLDRVVVTDKDLRRSIKYGMKPEQWAVRRLIAHEDRHVLTNFLAANDELGARFRELAARIPDAQLDDLANRRYPEFSDWRTSEIAKRSLQLEWFSEQAESDSPTDPTLLQQFLELLRELYAKVMGTSPEDVQDVELRQFLKRASQLQAQYAQQQLGSGIQEGFQASYPGVEANLPQFMRDSLATAQQMHESGKSAKEIRTATGWFPGKYDGKMRWEIPDKNAKWKGSSVEKSRFKLDELFEHEELFRAYPSLRNLEVKIVPSYARNEGSLYFDDLNGKAHMEISGFEPDYDRKSVVLHEIQHWIQAKEGFARGSSYREDNIINLARQRYVDSGAARREYDEVYKKLASKERERRNLESELLTKKVPFSKMRKQIAPLEQQERELQEKLDSITSGSVPASYARELYRNTAGEIEARDVQERADLSLEELQSKDPYSSENVAPEDAVILFNTRSLSENVQASMPEDSGYNYPPVPDTQDNFQDWIPVVDKARAKQLAWESFYRSNADENGNVDLPALTAAWKQEIARPDSPYLDAGQTEAFMEARRKPAEVYDAPRELTPPETGPRQTKRKAPAKQPTPEDIASRYPQFSQPEIDRRDAEYLKAVESGDMEKAQKIVDDAAKTAGFNLTSWHGSNQPNANFNYFLAGRGGYRFFADKEHASTYSGKDGTLRKFYLQSLKPLNLRGESVDGDVSSEEVRKILSSRGIDASSIEFSEKAPLWAQLQKDGVKDAIQSGGYDSIAVSERGSDVTRMVFNPSQIKSAEPVVRDDSGRIILPSERFNPASPDIRFSQPELSPEDEIAQIRQRAERFVSIGQQEGMDPVQATKDERTFSQSGRQADFSRERQTNAEQNADAQREMDLLISLSPDGPSLELGQGLLSYLKGGNDPNGAPGNLLARMNMANYLDRQPQLRNLLGIDGAELERIRQQYLTVGGTILQTAAGNRIYEPMRKMEETANKLVSDNAQTELGSSDFEAMTKQVSADLTSEAKARVDSLEPDMVDALDLGAVKDMDFLGYSLALESFDQPTRLQIIDLLNELAELEDLLQLEAEMTAGPDIVQPSRPDIRSQNLTLAEVRQRIAAKKKKITKLVEDINKAKAENPVEEAKKIRSKVRKPRTPEVTSAQNDRMRGWVKGGKLDGVPTLYNVLKKYSQSNGLNRDSVFKFLMTTFPEADPNYILGVVNRMGDLLDGVATKEGILDDLKRSGVPDKKMVEKMLKVAQKAAIGKRKAIENFKNKLAKVKNPTPKKLRQRSTFVNSVIGAVETGMVDSDAVKDAFAEAYDLHGLTKERLQEMGDILQQIEAMPEGIPKETLFIEFNVLLNELAPTAKFSTFAHEALMGYVLSGASTMAMQLTGLGRFINPLAGTVEALWSAPGTTAQKIGRTVNPVNIFRVYLDGMQEVLRNIPQVAAGMSGVVTSKPEGLGAFPTTLANTRVNETSMSYTPAGRISKFRFQTPKLLQKMGLEPLVKLTRYPAWMVSRSFQVIRAAEGLVGTADRSMQWRMQMTYALMAGDKKLSFSQAYNKVSEALGDKTSQLWEDAKKQAKEEISKKLVGKMSLNARANEIVQDKIEEQWKQSLQNRPRELAALYGYKQDPITPLGAWAYGNISKLLHKNEGLLQYSKFSFLFARFFSNAIEAAWTRTPVGGLFALTLPSQKAENEMDEREKRIVQIFGSLQSYKDARMARAMSGTAMMAGLAGLMVMALKGWDPEDDEPPFFWITGDPIGEFSKKGLLEAGGWWKANTLYLGPLRLNYVNASPELATVIGAMGSMGDRFLFDKLLNYRENKETGEYERSNYQAYGKPVLEAFVAPVTRSTYRSWWDAAEALWQGDPTKVTKLISNPVVGTATALSPAGLVPTVKSLEKWDRSTEQPRSPKTSAQAFMSSVPFADELGLDAGKPLTTPFGQPLTPYPFWSFMSNTQDVPPHVAKAANTLALLGVSRLGPREEYFGWGMGELSSDGKKYLLNDADRAVVLAEIGTRFANKVNANAAELKKLEAGKDGTKKVRNKVSNLAEDARKEVLRSWSSAIKK